jgi:dipeptidyl aminopeptidase/acylaminoacyl peptidase
MVFRNILALTAALLMASAVQAASVPTGPPPVEDYGRLPAMEFVRLSPSGDRYAFIADDGQTRRLYVVTIDNKPLEVRDVGTTKVRDLRWVGEDRLLITNSSTVDLGIMFVSAKEELYGVGVLNISTHKFIQVFGGAGQTRVARVVFGDYGAARIQGRWYGFFGGLTYTSGNTHGFVDHSYPDLYRVDLDTGDMKRVADGQEKGHGWLVGPDGEVAARATLDQSTGDWRVMSGPVLGRELAAGHTTIGAPGRLSWGRARDLVLIDRPDSAGGGVLQELSLSGAPPTDVADEWTVSETLFDPASDLFIGYVSEGDERRGTLFSAAAQARLSGARKAFPGYQTHLESWSAGFDRIVVFTDGGDDSGTYWLVDVGRHSAHPLGTARPTVKAGDVGPVRMVAWKASDGLALSGVLTLPPGRPAKGLPLVVLPHGGPEARDYPGFDWLGQAFASRGYAVLQANFRGSAGYGQALRDAGFGQWGRKMQTDISDGVASLAAQGIVDPRRSCIIGASYGGYAALAGVMLQHGHYRCAVADAPVTDLTAFLTYEREQAGGPSAATRYWRRFMGAQSTTDPALHAISPVDHAAAADAPILLIHGKDDVVVPFAQSEAMQRALRAAGKPVDLVVMPGEDHWLSHAATRTLMLQSAMAFVMKYNPPDSEPAP